MAPPVTGHWTLVTGHWSGRGLSTCGLDSDQMTSPAFRINKVASWKIDYSQLSSEMVLEMSHFNHVLSKSINLKDFKDLNAVRAGWW